MLAVRRCSHQIANSLHLLFEKFDSVFKLSPTTAEMRSALFIAAAAGAACTAEARRVHHRTSSAAVVNTRPIIGILSMPTSYPGYENKSYFPASYVKWLEAAGARVVPLLYTSPAAEIQQQLQYLNGALFTGGGTDFTNPDGSLTQFAKTGLLIFNESVQAWSRGETFPLWGTCQGHELISFLGSNQNMSTLTGGFDSENLTIPLNLTTAAATSRLYGSMPANVLSIFANEPVTMNNHQMGVTPEDFAAAPALADRFAVLATNVDRVGKQFVSSMEGQQGLPIFTSQYHPEKPQFECECQRRGVVNGGCN